MRNPSSLSTSSSGTKTPCCSKVGIKKGPWTPEEDEVLSSYIKREGEGRWRTLPKRAGLLRCGKSCRLRWVNYLRPSVKRGRIAPDEEDLILRLHRLLGNRWSLIAGRIPGRTDNEIKNYWNIHLSKKLIRQGIDPRTHKPLNLIPTSTEIINERGYHHDHYHHHLASSSSPNPNPPSLVMKETAGSSHQATNFTTNPYQNHEPFINNDISMDSFMIGLLPSSHVHDHNHHEDYNEDTFSSFLDSLIINDNVFVNQQHELPPPPPPPPNMVASSFHHVLVSSALTKFNDGTSNWDTEIVSTMATGDDQEQQRAAEAAYDLSTYKTKYNTY